MLIKLKGLDGTDLWLESTAIVAMKRRVARNGPGEEDMSAVFISTGSGLDEWVVGMRVEEIVDMVNKKEVANGSGCCKRSGRYGAEV